MSRNPIVDSLLEALSNADADADRDPTIDLTAPPRIAWETATDAEKDAHIARLNAYALSMRRLFDWRKRAFRAWLAAKVN